MVLSPYNKFDNVPPGKQKMSFPERLSHFVEAVGVKVDQVRQEVSDFLFCAGLAFQTGDLKGFLKNSSGRSGIGGMFIIVVAVVLSVRVIASQMPAAIQDWGNVTTIGALSGSSVQDKSTWDLGKIGLLFGSVLMVVGLVIRK